MAYLTHQRQTLSRRLQTPAQIIDHKTYSSGIAFIHKVGSNTSLDMINYDVIMIMIQPISFIHKSG